MFSYGFYNSLNHDRKYNSRQLSTLIDCLITDGVFQSVGNFFATVPGNGLQVLVKSGLAWFDLTWNSNDAPIPLSLEVADVTLARIDAIVLEVNESGRTNTVKVLTGVPNVNPSKPALINTDLLHQHALAYVKVSGGATSIIASDIEIAVGKSECPFVTAILETANIDVLFANWESQFNTWSTDRENEFSTWFDNLKLQLTDDVVANLQRQIDELYEKTHGIYSGLTIPLESLGEEGDVYVKLK